MRRRVLELKKPTEANSTNDVVDGTDEDRLWECVQPEAMGECCGTYLNEKPGGFRGRKLGANWQPVVHEPKLCQDVVAQYLQKNGNWPRDSLVTDVRKHLLSLGWKIEFYTSKGVIRFRYTSPGNKSYHSLLQACRELGESDLVPVLPPIGNIEQPEKSKVLDPKSNVVVDNLDIEDCPQTIMLPDSNCDVLDRPVSPNSDALGVESKYCQAVVDWYKFGAMKGSDCKINKSETLEKTKKYLLALGWKFWYANKKGRLELRYTSPRGRIYYSLRMACKGCIDEGGLSENVARRHVESIIHSDEADHKNPLVGPKLSSTMTHTKFVVIQDEPSKKRSIVESSGIEQPKNLASHSIQSQFNLCGDKPKGSQPIRVLRSRKEVKKLVTPSSSNHKPRTVLSWLIDYNVVLPRAKVYYCRKDHIRMAEGQITRDGIKCNCCQKLFTLSSFEAHAGSKRHRPSASIFLEDGRSLLDCQIQMRNDNKKRRFTKEVHARKQDNRHRRENERENDSICSVCHYGGDLILCDQCPSSFHKSCLGLKDVPDGEWFCPSCCCGICKQGKFKEDTGQVLKCGQCGGTYHVSCLTSRGEDMLEDHSKEIWFCRKKCEEIFLGLRELMGKPIPVGVDNLTWTMLKSTEFDSSDPNALDIEALTESYSKLNVALEVMHECFKPVKVPHTGRDLVEDVIFSRGSELNRLNFRGFCTVLLERDDELIAVATVRVFGEKVAEVPLVATRFQHRRLGMCRILMNELEKKLMELGVERLTLPAIPSMLNTWTSSFGFSKMTDSERLQVLDYTFLDFPDTVMCQKLLMKITSSESSLPKGIWPSAISEVLQADDQIQESRIVNQGPVNRKRKRTNCYSKANKRIRRCAGGSTSSFSVAQTSQLINERCSEMKISMLCN